MKGTQMNEKHRRVRARFAPAVRFNVKTVPVRPAQTAELEQLKNRLLGGLSNGVIDEKSRELLRRAANDAAALVWLTGWPLLLFPLLLEEKVRAAQVQQQRQARVRQRSLDLMLKAA